MKRIVTVLAGLTLAAAVCSAAEAGNPWRAQSAAPDAPAQSQPYPTDAPSSRQLVYPPVDGSIPDGPGQVTPAPILPSPFAIPPGTYARPPGNPYSGYPAPGNGYDGYGGYGV